ncbi:MULTISPECIES: peptidoglycan editing factor PgeF [unclassified Paenibacillus]|uniref:peptidoglycan editing factor PgeF n=1 Tax=unclassified Paenibacillus TaxID=185978 RepID=UPI0036D2B21B
MEPFVQAREIENRNEAETPSLFLLSEWMDGDRGLAAGFSGRGGGVSSAPWNSLNIGLHVGDSPVDAVENRRRLAEAIGWPFEAWTCAEQVHGTLVAEVKAEDRGRGRIEQSDALAGCDAIMTNVPGLLLASFYADCVPLYFYEPQLGAVALAHAGWKGTVGEIAAKTVEAMGKAYGAAPESIQAAIGPSIGGCCYEVYGPVVEEIERLLVKLKLDQTFAESCLQRNENGKAFVNLKEINRQIMIKAGILPSRIEITNWCTGCRTDLFFSHRLEGGKTGRMASWIGIRER